MWPSRWSGEQLLTCYGAIWPRVARVNRLTWRNSVRDSKVQAFLRVSGWVSGGGISALDKEAANAV